VRELPKDEGYFFARPMWRRCGRRLMARGRRASHALRSSLWCQMRAGAKSERGWCARLCNGLKQRRATGTDCYALQASLCVRRPRSRPGPPHSPAAFARRDRAAGAPAAPEPRLTLARLALAFPLLLCLGRPTPLDAAPHGSQLAALHRFTSCLPIKVCRVRLSSAAPRTPRSLSRVRIRAARRGPRRWAANIRALPRHLSS
jgi:hypothetical protein